MILYSTDEWAGYGQHYHWNEYRLEKETVIKYKCHKRRFFDSPEDTWEEEENVLESWAVSDPALPKWIKPYLP